MNFYNEIDPEAAAWLRILIARKLIPDGVIDERSITEIQPHELTQYTQCHFFAGIGGWSLALELAGVDSNESLWTGSCPCQPFSGAGKGLGDKDPRHLWPAFFHLISKCRPKLVFGEQVADAIRKGWLDGVSADLESECYACGSVVLGAHSVGAPHIRKRLYWVADAHVSRPSGQRDMGQPCCSEASGRVDDSERERLQSCGNRHHGRDEREQFSATIEDGGFWSDSRWIYCRDGKYRRIPTEPALCPLADGLPYNLARRGSVRPALLKGAGNAIVPEVAANFIKAFYSLKK